MSHSDTIYLYTPAILSFLQGHPLVSIRSIFSTSCPKFPGLSCSHYDIWSYATIQCYSHSKSSLWTLMHSLFSNLMQNFPEVRRDFIRKAVNMKAIFNVSYEMSAKCTIMHSLVCKYQHKLAFTICLTVFCNGMTSLLSLVSFKVSLLHVVSLPLSPCIALQSRAVSLRLQVLAKTEA